MRSSSFFAPFAVPSSSPPPLGPWNLQAFRFAARLLVLCFLAHGGLVLLPVQTHASPLPCPVTTLFPVSDHLGSVQKLVTAAGTVVYEQSFLPFGQRDTAHTSEAPSVCSDGSASDPFPHGFTGHFQDDESGLVYMGGRYYNPATGHFMTPDPVLGSPGDTLSYDRYAYVRNNPINLTDPTGFNPLIGAIIGAIIGGISAAAAGRNIFWGMFLGAVAGAIGAGIGAGAAAGAGSGLTAGQIGGLIALVAVTGAVGTAIYGGDVLTNALVGAAGAAAGLWAGNMAHSLTSAGARGAVSVLAGGVIGGLTSSAMGGNFGEGFIYGAAAAGISIASIEIAKAAQRHLERQPTFTPEELQAAKERMLLVKTPADIPDIQEGASVLISQGVGNDTEGEGKKAVAAYLRAKPKYEGIVVVVQSDHGWGGGAVNRLLGGVSDPGHIKLVEAAVSQIMDVNKGGPVVLMGHSDGSTALDRALGNMGINGSESTSIYYFGSPMTHSSVQKVHWVVRSGDPVTWLGSYWRFRFLGFTDTTRLSGWGHSFEGYMRDAGGVW